MKADPFSGAVMCSVPSGRTKLIFWDGTGMCLFTKRLEEGVFRWSRPARSTSRSARYLTDVLTRIVNGHPNCDIDQRLSWAYRAQALKAVA
jgi:transposase